MFRTTSTPSNSNAQQFDGREFETQKVAWQTVLFPRVNSSEYHRFRKENDGKTHHDVTSDIVVNHFTGQEKPSYNQIVEFLQFTYIERPWQSEDEDILYIQIAQYLGQLTQRGWTALVNAIQIRFTGK